jgi:membrane protease YdiL (CAAX protease family)
MPEENSVVQEAMPAEAPPPLVADDKRLRWFELALVLLVAFSGYILSSLSILNGGTAAETHQKISTYAIGTVHEVISLLLLGYVLSRRKLRLRDLGMRWSLRSFVSGLPVTSVAFLSYCLGYSIIRFVAAAFSLSTTDPHTFHHPYPSWAAIPFFFLNPFFEELIVRGYLMTEVRELTGSTLPAILLSVAVQTSYHLYYGWTGALSLGFEFLVFSIYYARTRRLAPVIVAHELFDLYGFVRLIL